MLDRPPPFDLKTLGGGAAATAVAAMAMSTTPNHLDLDILK
jgi:hypothetical protein